MKISEIERQPSRSKFTKDEFIQKAKEIHGDKYDYSKLDYVTLSSKLPIICPDHGEFLQYGHHHLKGAGCKQCGIDNRSGSNSHERQKSINTMKKLLGDEFWSTYRPKLLGREQIEITCPTHGVKKYSFHRIKNHKECPSCVDDRKNQNIAAKSSEWEIYKREVKKETEKQWKYNRNFIRHYDEIRGKHEFHIDHEYSQYDGFVEGVPPEIVGHWTNLHLKIGRENIQKGKFSTKDKEQLYNHYYWAKRKFGK